ncbi:MAG: hypothetical protein VX670_12180, partial [Candidatus Latescibacterota bacterium]|nr:hypothetical protein [Candidatus Latescibacterota bacterium]
MDLAWLDQAGFRADVGEAAIALVAVEGVVLAFKVGREDIHIAVVVVVAPGYAHARLNLASAAIGETGWEGTVGKSTVAAVVI